MVAPGTKYLFVKVEVVNLRKDPANAAVPTAYQNPEGVKLLEQAQATEKSQSDRL